MLRHLEMFLPPHYMDLFMLMKMLLLLKTGYWQPRPLTIWSEIKVIHKFHIVVLRGMLWQNCFMHSY